MVYSDGQVDMEEFKCVKMDSIRLRDMHSMFIIILSWAYRSGNMLVHVLLIN